MTLEGKSCTCDGSRNRHRSGSGKVLTREWRALVGACVYLVSESARIMTGQIPHSGWRTATSGLPVIQSQTENNSVYTGVPLWVRRISVTTTC